MFGIGDDEDEEMLNPSAAQPPPEMAPGSAPMNPVVKDYISKKFNLGDFSPEKRQALVDQNSGYDTTGAISGALASLGAAFQGGNSVAAANNVANQRRAARKEDLADFDTGRKVQLEDEKNNPESKQSKLVQETVRRLYGKNIPEDQIGSITAANSDIILKPLELKEKLDATAANKALVNQARNQAAEDKRKSAMAAQDDKDSKALEKALGAGWAGRSGQAGVVQNKINASEAAEALLEQAKTQPGGLDSRQMEELAQSTARLLGSGTQASARVDALVPHTFWGNAQSMKEYLSNHPSGQGMQAFTDRLADTIKREKELALQQKRQFQIEGLPAHARLKNSNPDLYNQILQSQGIEPDMIDDKGQYKKPGGSFPRQIRKGNQTAMVNDDKELKEAMGEGWQ